MKAEQAGEREQEEEPEDSEDDDASIEGADASEPAPPLAECERLFQQATRLCADSGGDSPRLKAFLRRYCSMKEGEAVESKPKKLRVD